MTDALRLVQGLTTPTQVNQIVDWNRERNELTLDANLEVNLLAEEAGEYFSATLFVDRLDAVCDLLFVGVGTLAKTSNAFHLISKGLFGGVEFVITDFVGRVEEEGIAQEDFVGLIHDSMDIVIKANYAKGTEKDENGKIIKPADFVPPEAALTELVERYKNKSSQVATEQTQSLFEEQ